MKTVLHRFVATTLCVTVFATVPAFARYRQTKLPGIVSGKSLAIEGALGGGAVLTLLLLRKRGDNKPFQAPKEIGFKSTEYQKTVELLNKGSEPLSLSDVGFSGKGYSSAVRLPILIQPGKYELPVDREATGKKAKLKVTAVQPNGKSIDREIEIHMEK